MCLRTPFFPDRQRHAVGKLQRIVCKLFQGFKSMCKLTSKPISSLIFALASLSCIQSSTVFFCFGGVGGVWLLRVTTLVAALGFSPAWSAFLIKYVQMSATIQWLVKRLEYVQRILGTGLGNTHLHVSPPKVTLLPSRA